MATAHYGFTAALVVCHFMHILVANQSQITDPSEGNALLAIRSSLTDPVGYLRNWNEGDPCTSNWTGLICSGTAGPDGYLHIQVLQLMNMNLSGSLAPEIGLLSHLKILNFLWNGLSGAIPKDIGKITSLRLLLLSGNNLSGSLPEQLGNLANLDRLQVDQNQLSGPIPKSFASLVNVKHLHMNNNSFTGQIPPELSSLPNLIHILFDNNNLSGYLPPQLAQVPNLRILQLDNNNFDGAKIPASFGNFTSLVKLSLRNCSLRGAVPDISGIHNLAYLDLSLNDLLGPIPSRNLSDKITTINLSDNRLNGTIPDSFSRLPVLQRLSIQNNNLSGPIPSSIWQNMSFSGSDKLWIDFRNNSLSGMSGALNPPPNVTLRLAGNPVCQSSNIHSLSQYCQSQPAGDPADSVDYLKKSGMICPIQACPVDNFYEYVPASPDPCFCASPLRIGYRLKSPGFSYFRPYISEFERYITQSLMLDIYQLSIDTFAWEEGPRLRMYLKVFPAAAGNASAFNESEVQRIRCIFSSWRFPGSDFFGPYELLNFTLVGPYANMAVEDMGGRRVSKVVLAGIIIAAVACALATSAVASFIITRRHMKWQYALSRRRLSSRYISMKIDGVKAFSFKEMVQATNNFSSSSQVGQGGYGKVYRGVLCDGKAVAIKRAEEGSLQGQKEFLTEIQLLSRLHHRNLVSLMGYCDEEGEQMLIYEFMPNGSLRDWLFGNDAEGKGSKLDFGRRLAIAMGSAKGILYLHTEADPPVFHRDIKSSNILLDSNLTAKMADFGLSRLAPVLEHEGAVPNYVSTVVKGTPGYLDPEYFLTHKLTDKSDVYSLGIVFLELLTGMQPISHGKNIVREVNMAHEQSGSVFAIVDSRMGSYPSECVDKFLGLALSCCHDKQEKRPSMLDVVRQLEAILGMMPLPTVQTESKSSISTSSASDLMTTSYSAARKSASSPSNTNCSYPHHFCFSVTGSDLVSGVTPTIAPR